MLAFLFFSFRVIPRVAPPFRVGGWICSTLRGKGLWGFSGPNAAGGIQGRFFWGEKTGESGGETTQTWATPPWPLAARRGAARRLQGLRQVLLCLSAIGRLNLGIQDPRLGLRSARAWVLHALRPGLKKRVWAASRQGADGRRNGEKLGRRMAGWPDARRPIAFCRFDST